MFANNGHGFTLTFANGFSVSVQHGRGNYCGNRWLPEGAHLERCRTAEVQVFTPHGDPDGTERGYLNADQVAAVIAEVAAYGFQV